MPLDLFIWVHSSAGEHYLHTVGVTGSIPVAPTTFYTLCLRQSKKFYMRTKLSNNVIAVILALGTSFLWVLYSVLLKFVAESGFPDGQTLIIVSVSVMATMFAISVISKKTHQLKIHDIKIHLVIGVFLSLSNVCWLLALPQLPLANMYAVQFLSPLLIALLAPIFLKDYLGIKNAVAIIIGFIGVFIAINPDDMLLLREKLFPYLLVFVQMAAYSLQAFILRMTSNKEAPLATAIYPRIVLIITGLIMCLFGEGFLSVTNQQELKTLLVLIFCGVIVGLGWVFLAKAYKMASAILVSPCQYFKIIFGAILGYLFFSDLPSWSLCIGSVIIITSGIYLLYNENKRKC